MVFENKKVKSSVPWEMVSKSSLLLVCTYCWLGKRTQGLGEDFYVEVTEAVHYKTS